MFSHPETVSAAAVILFFGPFGKVQFVSSSDRRAKSLKNILEMPQA